MIDEINLPINSVIYEPKIKDHQKLTDSVIKEKLRLSHVINKIIENPTLVIINDSHRSTPSHKILRLLLDQAPNHKIEKIIIATGTHSKPNPTEIENLLPKMKYRKNIDILTHDSKSEDLASLGKTSRGTNVYVNRIIGEYDQILSINSVEPHYFAGFTGGVKSLIPGLAGLSTIEQNHSWAIDPNSLPTKIKKNPLQQDLREALGLIDNSLLGIQLVSVGSDVYDVQTGSLMEAFERARLTALKMFCHKIPEQIDIVLSIVYPPLDRSLYQAQKGIENTRQILRKGGKMILMAACPEGVGNKAFYETLQNYKTPEEVVNNLTRENYNFGDHKAVNFATINLQGELFLVSNLSYKESQNVFAEKLEISKLEIFLKEASDNGKKIAVVLDSGIVVMTI